MKWVFSNIRIDEELRKPWKASFLHPSCRGNFRKRKRFKLYKKARLQHAATEYVNGRHDAIWNNWGRWLDQSRHREGFISVMASWELRTVGQGFTGCHYAPLYCLLLLIIISLSVCVCVCVCVCKALSVQSSLSVMSDSLWPHGLQHGRPPCPSPTPGAYSNSCPLSRWCHPTLLSSVAPFSSCLQSFPASGAFPMSQFFASICQSIRVSASASVLSMNIQDWSPLGWTGWISLQSKGLSRVFSNTSSKASVLQCSVFFIVQLSHPYMTTGKTIALTWQTFVGKVMSLLFF